MTDDNKAQAAEGDETIAQLRAEVERLTRERTEIEALFWQIAQQNSVRIERIAELEAAQAVPEGYVVVPKEMHLDRSVIDALLYVIGGPDEDGEDKYADGTVWIGELPADGDTPAVYGINVFNDECPEEGSINLIELDRLLSAAPQSPQGAQINVVREYCCCGECSTEETFRPEVDELKWAEGHAWEQYKADLDPSAWTTAEGFNFRQFFMTGFSAATCFFRQRTSPQSTAPVPEVTDALAYAFHHAISDGSIGESDVEDIKRGLRAVVAALSAAPQPAAPNLVSVVRAHCDDLRQVVPTLRAYKMSATADEVEKAISELVAAAPAKPVPESAANDLAIMLRRMIRFANKLDGDREIKVIAGNAAELLRRYELQGSPLRAKAAPVPLSEEHIYIGWRDGYAVHVGGKPLDHEMQQFDYVKKYVLDARITPPAQGE